MHLTSSPGNLDAQLGVDETPKCSTIVFPSFLPQSLGLVSAEATRLLDGVGHHISCVAVAFLATTLPSLR